MCRTPTPDLFKYNTRPIGTNDLNHDIQARIESLNTKVRKNAVLAVEHLITSGVKAFNYHKGKDGQLYGDVKLWKSFEDNAMAWLSERYGKENIVNFTVHKDEQVPHIHAVVVPVVDGKLNCKALLGNRNKMRDMQTSIAEKMKSLGFERGVEGSKATHTKLKRFYGNLKKGEELSKELAKKIPVFEIGDVPFTNRAKWKEEQELLLNRKIEEYFKEAYLPFIEIHYHVLDENKKMERQIKLLSGENKMLSQKAKSYLQDLRTILSEKRITKALERTYIPDILRERERASNKQQGLGGYGMGM